ncbi:MAG: DUF1553 domain-containing protein [Armatimonadota bacterium]
MSTLRNQSRSRQAAGIVSALLLPLAVALWSEAAPAAKASAAKKPATSTRKPAANAKAAPKAAAAALPAEVRYNRDVRPILADNCFACHGPDSAARKANLRLDTFADATQARNGRAAVVPKNPAKSELVKRILGDGPLMPPASSHKKLTKAQIEILKRWVAQGAEYEKHWSYIPPRRSALPKVKNAAWVRNPIDRFVLARLEAAGLSPAPEADRPALIRRLSLDLTGLPPKPEEVEAFVKDRSPDAYEKLVDRLLASPHWGEHRGRYWLDGARYADTHGIHFDNFREVWSYRDWVIQAFNQNLPFDQFTIEQLAGDLLPKPSLDQLVATGFNRCNITTNEGGVIPEEYAVLYTRDRTETVAQVWMGQTAGCAVCHDHKFDPLSQREFYELAAFFNNSTQNPMDGNIKDTPPIVNVPLREDRSRFEALQGELETGRKQAEARKQAARADFDAWLARGASDEVKKTVPGEKLAFHAPLSQAQGDGLAATANGQPVTLKAAAAPAWTAGHVSEKAFQRPAGGAIEAPEAGDFEKDRPFTAAAWVKIVNGQGGSILARMDDQNDFRGWDLWLEGGRIGTHLVNKWPEDALKVVAREPLQAGRWHHVALVYNGTPNPGGIRIYVDGVAKEHDTQANALKSTIRTTVPLKIGQRHTTAGVDGAGIEDVRLYDAALDADAIQRLAKGTRAAYLASRGVDKLQPAEKDELFGWWLPGVDEQFRTLAVRLASLESEERAIRFRGTIAHVMQERSEPAKAFILFRGDYDKRRDEVKPGTPAVLPPMPADFPRNRLGFAKWLLLPEHPLTTRVTVNRFWQELFGTGLVSTPGDFGITGQLPSHPELLDWLAVDFREGGWDMKRLFKLIVTSATYRQSSIISPEKAKKDPENRLLSRGPRYRLDAEVIRDYALAASGLLVPKLGGPSVKPYQPDGVWEAVAMIGSNTRDYRRDSGESLYRRSMYTFWKRSAPPASMDVLNAPSREFCVVKRERTNTPLQALVTLNDVQYVEAARHLAQQALKEGGPSADSRIQHVARRLLARSFRPEEMQVVRQSLAELEGFYRGHGKEARELIAVGESKADPTVQPERLAAWTMLVNQLMNLDEVLNK